MLTLSTENLFSHMGAPRSFDHQMHHRGFSELSNRSRRAVVAPPPIVTHGPASLMDRSNQAPVRQPEERGEGHRDGFVRFLKQHASPPHNRVTAGGRIVPAGPNSPPPMFNFESLTGMAEENRRNASNIPPLSAPPGLAAGLSSGWPRVRYNDFKDYTGNKRLQSNLPVTPLVQNNLFPYGNHMMPSTPQSAVQTMSSSLVPVGAFEDGSFISMNSGIYYRTYWNGIGFVVEPLSIPTGPLPFAAPSPVQPPTMPAHMQQNGSYGAPAPNQRMPLANTTNRSSSFSNGDQRTPKTMQLLGAQQQNLKEELHKLDRHLALHHYQLNQEQKNQCVSQRRSLVENIDNIRRVREPSAPDLPIIDVRDLAKHARGRNSKSRSEQQSSSIGFDLKFVSKPLKLNAKTRKALSPNAAPFVPSSKVQMPAADTQVSTYGNTSSGQRFKTALQAEKGIVSPLSNVGKAHPLENSLDKDSDDPAMRIIHNSDIAYAAKFEYDVIDGKKKYCSKVYEFQEALRRVRQQARLHGCAGGSSKDPAYDAEQDIWWAICDNDPIPLPQDQPDHVIDPRPWDWNDSAFNHRCIGRAARREAVSLRSTSGISADLSAKVVASGPLASKAKDQAQESGQYMYQLSARKSSVLPSKSTRALKEVKNPPGPKRYLSQGHPHDKTTPDKSEKRVARVQDHEPSPPQQMVTEFDKQNSRKANDVTLKQARSQTIVEKKDVMPLRNSAQTTAIDAGDSSRQSSAPSEAAPSTATQLKPTQNQKNSYREEPRGPRKTKSKQQMRETNSLRRHRQAIHQAQTAKRPSILNFQDLKPPSIHSEPDVKVQSEVSSEATQASFLSRTSQQLSPRGAAKKALQFYDRSRTKSPL